MRKISYNIQILFVQKYLWYKYSQSDKVVQLSTQ